MSAVVACDTCGKTVPPDSDPAMDWIAVGWGIGQNRIGGSDYCSPKCAHAGIDAEAEVRAVEAAAVAGELE